jgi:uracil-DNA glycosylase family 4
MAIAIADHLIDSGLKQEDVSKVVEGMSSYYNRLNMIGNKITSCSACSLRDGCHVPIAGIGPLRPEIVVVSDYPPLGKDDLSIIEVQVVMMMLLSRIPLNVEDIYWTHAVKCRADRVTMGHIKECYVHLVNEIAILQPAAIVALGSVAISSLATEHISINDAIDGEFHFEMGNPQNGSERRIPVIPVYHPRTLMGIDKAEFKDKMNRMWKNIRVISDYL